MLLKSAVYLITAFGVLGIVTCVEKVDRDCLNKFGGVNFMAWVVRVMVKDSADPRHHMKDVATGNIITENYVLTACTPFSRIIEDDLWHSVRVAVTVNEYSKVEPDRRRGIFPYASNTSGCTVAWYSVDNYERVSEFRCNKDLAGWPDKMLNNLLLLKLLDGITVGDDKLFPRMPFSYQNDAIIRRIDWFNVFRRARCIIARWRPIVSPRGTDSVVSPLFEWRGFHYKTMPYIGKCMQVLCQKNCTNARTKDIPKACITGCAARMQRLLGILMCLIRMDEKQLASDKLFSQNFDADDKHQEYNKVQKTNLDCQKDENSLIMGSPVVCGGEVIAIVTKCTPEFLVATSILHIRHHILEKFDTSYMEHLEFLSDDGTADDKE